MSHSGDTALPAAFGPVKLKFLRQRPASRRPHSRLRKEKGKGNTFPFLGETKTENSMIQGYSMIIKGLVLSLTTRFKNVVALGYVWGLLKPRSFVHHFSLSFVSYL